MKIGVALVLGGGEDGGGDDGGGEVGGGEVGGGEDAVAALTAMANGASLAEVLPLLALITMSLSVPTFADDGLPVSEPVVLLKVAQAGLLEILKVTVRLDVL